MEMWPISPPAWFSPTTGTSSMSTEVPMPRRNQTNMRLGPPWPKNRSASMPLVESLSTLTGTANRCSSGVRRSTSCQPRAVERRTMPFTTTPGAATPMPMTWSV